MEGTGNGGGGLVRPEAVAHVLSLLRYYRVISVLGRRTVPANKRLFSSQYRRLLRNARAVDSSITIYFNIYHICSGVDGFAK